MSEKLSPIDNSLLTQTIHTFADLYVDVGQQFQLFLKASFSNLKKA